MILFCIIIFVNCILDNRKSNSPLKCIVPILFVFEKRNGNSTALAPMF